MCLGIREGRPYRFHWALQEEDARAWLAKVLSSLPHEERVRVVVTMWAIWHVRRKAIHENIFEGPLSTHGFIIRFVDGVFWYTKHVHYTLDWI
jgi:hypothetical protein